MSKKCVITQIHNEEKQQYEYFVKGYDITESVKILLKKHKEAYDKERRIFAEAKGYIEAQKEYKTQLHNQQNEIQQLKQQLEEKDEQIKKRVMVYEKQFIEQTDEIYSLKQQLAEKQNAIDEINKEFVQAVHDWKTLCAEKDKEIEVLRKGEYQKCCQHCEAFQHLVEVSKQDANDLAIQELEKVKEWLEPKYFDYEQINYLNNIIDNQINDLKMGKDYMPINTKGE